jgi:type IV secretory pathway TrbL component
VYVGFAFVEPRDATADAVAAARAANATVRDALDAAPPPSAAAASAATAAQTAQRRQPPPGFGKVHKAVVNGESSNGSSFPANARRRFT